MALHARRLLKFSARCRVYLTARKPPTNEETAVGMHLFTFCKKSQQDLVALRAFPLCASETATMLRTEMQRPKPSPRMRIV
jgi:hypothetical protein